MLAPLVDDGIDVIYGDGEDRQRGEHIETEEGVFL